MKEDIINYPPALTVIRTLCDIGYNVIHIGRYSDIEQKNELTEKGVVFIDSEKYNGQTNLISKFIQQSNFKKLVHSVIQKYKIDEDDYVWLLNAETIRLLGSLAYRYKTIFHYFEFTTPYINWKYRLVNPFEDPFELNKQAYRIVQCEYNRAHIFKAFLHLDTLPIVLPNKPYEFKNIGEGNLPNDVRNIIDDLQQRIAGKKVILYQGVFQGKDRRLDEFFEAVLSLPKNFVFLAMGGTSPNYLELKQKYESERVIFVPFIRPPYHLEVTKLCDVGILSYVANETTVAGAINPIYCAPNKIFEYSKFGKPMISNDLPGLNTIFKIYGCGVSIDYPITSDKISAKVLSIFENYENYSRGAKRYYDSVNIENIIKEIL